MEEKNLELLSQYAPGAVRIGRMKGAYLLEGDQGVFLFTAYPFSEGKAVVIQEIKEILSCKGFSDTDFYMKNNEDHYIVYSTYGDGFLLKRFSKAEECNIKSTEQIMLSVRTLAQIHRIFTAPECMKPEYEILYQPLQTELMEKRNRELKRVKSYIWEKKQKNPFEILYMTAFDYFYKEALEAKRLLQRDSYEAYYRKCIDEGRFLHGNYTHHNVLPEENGRVTVINFEKAEIGIQIVDFYLFFRKIMEKTDWDGVLAGEMLAAYEEVREIPKQERILLAVLLLYPEKFWKVTNRYYNNRKSWIPGRNMQKLQMVISQAEKKSFLVRSLFAKELTGD